ncbi:ImmA/IrrE family metallo-endopeptidase [Lolliginicoccus levis]|uniref:ImmA/IrrE family metallo-endopeptidase n=1 Tax=Lolliginicoccus levis TaxID=2919542 RepID=UPI00241F0BA7|nr:ImmA/IrrE family metallo-endopeptidase [Lolliginicoccus levis]
MPDRHDLEQARRLADAVPLSPPYTIELILSELTVRHGTPILLREGQTGPFSAYTETTREAHTIYLPSLGETRAQTWVIAHELGHILMGDTLGAAIPHHPESESRADAFADRLVERLAARRHILTKRPHLGEAMERFARELGIYE